MFEPHKTQFVPSAKVYGGSAHYDCECEACVLPPGRRSLLPPTALLCSPRTLLRVALRRLSFQEHCIDHEDAGLDEVAVAPPWYVWKDVCLRRAFYTSVIVVNVNRHDCLVRMGSAYARNSCPLRADCCPAVARQNIPDTSPPTSAHVLHALPWRAQLASLNTGLQLLLPHLAWRPCTGCTCLPDSRSRARPRDQLHIDRDPHHHGVSPLG